mmetsp:Transcript_10254/g.31333  ORF Transcript_10254/g.31333 Transcript_10254/m.31333 type:complete len:345 (-) Transcript_10254:77-1111(-)
MALAVSPQGSYNLVPHLTLDFEKPCPGRIKIEGKPSGQGTVGKESVKWPTKSLKFGAKCKGTSVTFFNQKDAFSNPKVNSAVQKVLKIPGVNTALLTLLTLKFVVGFIFDSPAQCGVHKYSPTAPIGIIYRGQSGKKIRDTKLRPSTKYVQYLFIGKIKNKPALTGLCSYSNKPLPASGKGSPPIAGTYKPLFKFTTCFNRFKLTSGGRSPDGGVSYVMPSTSIFVDGKKCNRGASLVLVKYKDAQRSEAFIYLFKKLRGTPFFRILQRIQKDVGGGDLWAFTLVGDLKCGKRDSKFLKFGVIFKASKSGPIGTFLSAKKGQKFLLSGVLSKKGTAFGLCSYNT